MHHVTCVSDTNDSSLFLLLKFEVNALWYGRCERRNKSAQAATVLAQWRGDASPNASRRDSGETDADRDASQ
jgi:hypothetical protein